jgi:hypothetical protein
MILAKGVSAHQQLPGRHRHNAAAGCCPGQHAAVARTGTWVRTVAFSHSLRRFAADSVGCGRDDRVGQVGAGEGCGARCGAGKSAMKDAGLTEPIPGLAEMDGQGKFFACAPYGTCWEPTGGWGGDKAEMAQAEAHPGAGSGSASAQAETQPAAPVERVAPSDDQAAPAGAPAVAGAQKATGASKATGQSAADAYLASHPGAILRTEDYIFPCSEFAVRDLIAEDPVTGKEMIVGSEFVTDGYPYFRGMALCRGISASDVQCASGCRIRYGVLMRLMDSMAMNRGIGRSAMPGAGSAGSTAMCGLRGPSGTISRRCAG